MTFLDASVPIGRHWRVGPLSVWGKLPSQGDCLRHRTTVGQARDWQDWVDRVWARRPGAQEGQRRQALAWTASGREILPPPRISSDLADLPVTFVMQPGTLPFAPRHCVQGVAVASSDEAGRACPLIFFQRVTRGWLRRSWKSHESTRSHVDVLHALSRLAARIPAPGTDAATVIRAVDALDALYRPGWPHWFGKPLPTPSRLQLDALLRSHLGGHATDLAADLQGVMHMPWAGWPSQIVRERSPTSAFWQQDAHGGHLGASEDLARLGAGVATGSAAPTPRDAATGPQLVGLRHHGMEFDFRWTWGVGPDTQGFDGILPEGMLPSLAGRGGLAAIALHRDGPDDRAHWW
ncbi:MAG TPA: hypothetical protein VLK29_07755, partial [Luteimonas sp.]|nr:hypothetical protein [Luteimonas sp.]